MNKSDEKAIANIVLLNKELNKEIRKLKDAVKESKAEVVRVQQLNAELHNKLNGK